MKKINWQIFISFNLLFSFLMMLVSGIILYFKPEGSVARWLDWEILSLSKSNWESIHTIFSFLFMIIAFFHILKIHLFNFFVYLNKKHHYALKEFFFALAFCVIVLIGTTFKVHPFQSVYDFGNQLSDMWKESYTEPDEPISASSALGEIAEYHQVRDSVIVGKLHDAGFSGVKSDLTLNQIASRNDISPQRIYSEITDIKKLKTEGISNKGHTITISEIAFILKIDSMDVIRFLENKQGVNNIERGTSLMEICNKINITCAELRNELYQLKKKSGIGSRE